MAAYRRVYDSRHLQADCQGPESAPEPYAWYSSMGHIYFLYCGSSDFSMAVVNRFFIELNNANITTQLFFDYFLKRLSESYRQQRCGV